MQCEHCRTKHNASQNAQLAGSSCFRAAFSSPLTLPSLPPTSAENGHAAGVFRIHFGLHGSLRQSGAVRFDVQSPQNISAHFVQTYVFIFSTDLFY